MHLLASQQNNGHSYTLREMDFFLTSSCLINVYSEQDNSSDVE